MYIYVCVYVKKVDQQTKYKSENYKIFTRKPRGKS